MFGSSRRQTWVLGCFLSGLMVLLGGAAVRGALPTEDAERAKVVGQPVSLKVHPAKVELAGPRALQQLVVMGVYADGNERDLTHFCAMSIEDKEVAAISVDGFLVPRKDGDTSLKVQAGGQGVSVPVKVRDFTKDEPVSFRHQVIASLNVGGCNAGACHGTPSGKNGFKLTLRGYDPAADYKELTRDVLGRRSDRNEPAASLFYQKATGKVPHEGGQRFLPNSVPAQALLQWLTEGLRDDPAKLPAVQKIDPGFA